MPALFPCHEVIKSRLVTSYNNHPGRMIRPRTVCWVDNLRLLVAAHDWASRHCRAAWLLWQHLEMIHLYLWNNGKTKPRNPNRKVRDVCSRDMCGLLDVFCRSSIMFCRFLSFSKIWKSLFNQSSLQDSNFRILRFLELWSLLMVPDNRANSIWLFTHVSFSPRGQRETLGCLQVRLHQERR